MGVGGGLGERSFVVAVVVGRREEVGWVGSLMRGGRRGRKGRERRTKSQYGRDVEGKKGKDVEMSRCGIKR